VAQKRPASERHGRQSGNRRLTAASELKPFVPPPALPSAAIISRPFRCQLQNA
jgi:hypothetical protein